MEFAMYGRDLEEVYNTVTVNLEQRSRAPVRNAPNLIEFAFYCDEDCGPALGPEGSEVAGMLRDFQYALIDAIVEATDFIFAARMRVAYGGSLFFFTAATRNGPHSTSL
jgi:hypothetical protein